IGQALWSIGLRARAPSFPLLAEGLLERSPRPDFIALIDADNETVISRLRERAGSTSRLEQSDLGPDALVTARRRLREVVTALARLEVPPRVQRIVNDREYAAPACAVAIVDWLADNCDLSALEVRT
ncbi:MAG: hypothetical protein OES47_14740, partial [Acidobacteriota bacterium]|nr:hypothetical protein [Acidobacteriota bacterium]